MTTPVSWQVTGQLADQSDLTTGGQVITGILVYFITGLGQRGSVFVPDDQYSPATVAAMIAARAQAMDSVFALTDQTQLD